MAAGKEVGVQLYAVGCVAMTGVGHFLCLKMVKAVQGGTATMEYMHEGKNLTEIG